MLFTYVGMNSTNLPRYTYIDTLHTINRYEVWNVFTYVGMEGINSRSLPNVRLVFLIASLE